MEVILREFGDDVRHGACLAAPPPGRAPRLIDGEVTIFETGAIAEWLCETRDPTGLWRGPGDPERAAWLQWLHVADTMTAHIGALMAQHIVYRPEARPPAVMKIEAQRLALALGVVDRALDGCAGWVRWTGAPTSRLRVAARWMWRWGAPSTSPGALHLSKRAEGSPPAPPPSAPAPPFALLSRPKASRRSMGRLSIRSRPTPDALWPGGPAPRPGEGRRSRMSRRSRRRSAARGRDRTASGPCAGTRPGRPPPPLCNFAFAHMARCA